MKYLIALLMVFMATTAYGWDWETEDDYYVENNIFDRPMGAGPYYDRGYRQDPYYQERMEQNVIIEDFRNQIDQENRKAYRGW